MTEKDSPPCPHTPGVISLLFLPLPQPQAQCVPRTKDKEETVNFMNRELNSSLSHPNTPAKPSLFQGQPKGFSHKNRAAVLGTGESGVQAGKAKPRGRHKTYEGWWHHGGPRWEGGRRCWGPGTRIGNRLLRERKVIGPRMGKEMGFCKREQKGSRG